MWEGSSKINVVYEWSLKWYWRLRDRTQRPTICNRLTPVICNHHHCWKSEKWWENSQSDYLWLYICIVREMVFCFKNCSDLLWKNIFLVIKNNLFKQFIAREFFLTYYWRFLRLNASTLMSVRLWNFKDGGS